MQNYAGAHKGKALLSIDQFLKACQSMFEKLLLVILKALMDLHPHVIAIFSPHNQYGDVCKNKTRA